MLWQCVAPDKERVVICENYIRHEIKHGAYIRAENIVNMFPQFFVRILEPEVKPVEIVIEQPKVEIPVVVVEEIVEEVVNIVEESMEELEVKKITSKKKG
jgi:hypothetical protein